MLRCSIHLTNEPRDAAHEPTGMRNGLSLDSISLPQDCREARYGPEQGIGGERGSRLGMTGHNPVVMTSSDLWDAATAERYDDGSAFMYRPEVLDPAVAFLAELAGAGNTPGVSAHAATVEIHYAERRSSRRRPRAAGSTVDNVHASWSVVTPAPGAGPAAPPAARPTG